MALILCFHLYTIKMERAVAQRLTEFNTVTAQVNHAMKSINDLLNTMIDELAQSTQQSGVSIMPKSVSQYADYYYHFTNQGTEIVGKGNFLVSPNLIERWQQASRLGSSFNTTLALMQSLSAVAYVDDGFAYVARRNKSKSLLLTEILSGHLKPNTTSSILGSSSIIEIDDKAYFAIGRQVETGSSDYIIVIYDVAVLSQWLKNVSPKHGEFVFLNTLNQIIVSSKQTLSKAIDIDVYWPDMVNQQSLLLSENKSNYFIQPKANLPIYAAYYQSSAEIIHAIRYEMIVEFLFLTLFLCIMFSVFFWLSQRIFLKPMMHLMHYLEQGGELSSQQQHYQIPLNWQPWFFKVKQVFKKNNQLVESLQNVNKDLDEKVQLQSEKLKRSYQAKERHLALLNTMLNSVPDFIYFKNIDGSFLGCNKAFEAYIGESQSALIGKHLKDVSTEHNQIGSIEKQVLKNRTTFQQRIETNNKSYQLTIAPFYNEHQHLLGTMGIGRDITEQQYALSALKASEAKFRSAIEYAANSVILLSLEHKIIQVNKATRKLFIAEKKLVGKALNTLFDESQWLEISTALAKLLVDKKEVYHLTLARGKLTSWLQLSVSLVWDENYEPSYYVIHLQDVSALTKAKHDAERATLAKSRFIANLSHEIRTPLNAVLGLLDMVIEQGLAHKQLQQTKQAKHAAQSLLLMLNRMLDFARVESDQAQLKLTSLSVVELVDVCDSLISPLCEQKGIKFIIDVDPLIAANLICDSIRLQQVLGNLLTNAVKFTSSGTITLKMDLLNADTEGQQICFKVIDTGSGIDKADQQRLFDAFTQGDESTTRIHQGVGLGLAIVKYTVSLMQGEICINSEKGQGCEFYFNIRLQVDKKKNHRLAHNMHAVISPFSQALKCVSDAYDELSFIDIKKVIANPHTLSNNKQIIIDENDLPALLSVPVINEILSADSVPLIIINHQQTLNLLITEQLNAKHVKVFALGQRLLDLSNSSQPKEVLQSASVKSVPSDKAINGMLILAIDDNQLNLEVITSILHSADINIVTATSALHGIELVNTLQPDLVLMDIQMPHMDGCQAADLIRQKFDASQLPIFALTANSEPEDINRSFKHGMNKHLTKPVVASVLLDAIADTQSTKLAFFDKSFALAQFGHDRSLLDNMIEKFAEFCTEQLQLINNDVNKDDLVRIVHGIKGVSGNLGFKRLSDCALKSEKQLKQTNEPIHLIIEELSMQVSQVIVFIEFWSN